MFDLGEEMYVIAFAVRYLGLSSSRVQLNCQKDKLMILDQNYGSLFFVRMYYLNIIAFGGNLKHGVLVLRSHLNLLSTV